MYNTGNGQYMSQALFVDMIVRDMPDNGEQRNREAQVSLFFLQGSHNNNPHLFLHLQQCTVYNL